MTQAAYRRLHRQPMASRIETVVKSADGAASYKTQGLKSYTYQS